MPATAQYHVVLDGQGYLIDLASYNKSAAPPFAPKTRVGDAGYGDLQFGSVWAAENWRGGLGWGTPFESFDPANPTRFKEGIGIDPTFGDLRMGRAITSVANAAINGFYQLVAHRGILFAISESTADVYQSTNGGSSFTVAFATGAIGGLRSMAAAAGTLFVGEGGPNDPARIWRRSTAGTWALWGTLAAGINSVRSLQGWSQAGNVVAKLYIGASLANGTFQVISSPADTFAMTTVHDGGMPHVEAMAMVANRLYYAPIEDTSSFGFRGELYSNDGTTTVTRVTSISDNAISSMIEWRGKLYAGSRTRGKIWIVESQGLTELFTMPDATFIAGVSQYAFPIRALAIDHDRLHFPVVDTQGLGIYTYDGVGWSRSVAGGAGTEPRGLVSFNNRLFISNAITNDSRIYRVENTFRTSGTFISSWFNAELAGIDKVLRKATIRHSALASGQSITVDYAIDGSATYTNLGISNTIGSTEKAFTFASATVAKSIRFRLVFALTGTSATPSVTAILLEYALAPDPKAEWTFDALLEGVTEMPLVRLDNSVETLTGSALADALWTSRAKKQTLAFTDLDAEAKTIWFVDLEEVVAKQSQREGSTTRGRAKLVEA